jgi:hypothetical protein
MTLLGGATEVAESSIVVQTTELPRAFDERGSNRKFLRGNFFSRKISAGKFPQFRFDTECAETILVNGRLILETTGV